MKPSGWSALVGLTSAGGGLALAELTALILSPQSSPVLAIGSLTIDLAPKWVKDLVIQWFGTGDKVFLIALLLVVAAAVALLAGFLEFRRRPWGTVIFAVLGVVGTVAVTTREQASFIWAVPTVVGAVGACLLLRVMTQRLRTWSWVAGDAGTALSPDAATSRRGFLTVVIGSAAAAVVVGVGARVANAASVAVDTVRTALTLPKPTTAAPPIPAGAMLDVDGLTPLVIPNDLFYRIDTALQVPSIDPANWSLRITGMVEKEVEITFDELLELPLIETFATLSCVSNEVGGGLVGNAKWLGYPIHKLLAEAKPLAGADMVLSRSIDGFTASSPLEVLQDEERNSILAVGMNDEPLPAEHGFPVRMVVPGLYGYVSATKWVTEMKLTTFDQDRAYWTDRGWSEKGPVKLSSRIDVPTYGSTVKSGKVAVAGMAWSPHVGVAEVEVRIDGGSWKPATLSTPISTDTWVQWVYEWDAESGDHAVEVRATDATGFTQSNTPVPVAPNGSEGWHGVLVRVG